MNTLTAIEAERVNQILKHAIDRLQILSYIPTSWDDDIVVDIKCPPVLNSLERLWMCEEQLKELDANLNNGGGGEGGVKDINILKQLHRVLMGRPELQSEDFSKFIRYLNELRSQVMQKLTTTVEDEAANRTLLHDLTERERHYEESRDVLQTKLNELRHEREHVSAGLDQTLRKLQHELHEITQHNNLEIESVQKEMNEAINKATADHELKMRQLQDRVDALERQVNEVIEKNKEEEQRLRREKSRMESALNAKIAQYDEDMDSRQKILDELNRSLAKESADYALLKEHFDKIDADISRHTEEDTIIAAVKRREQFGQFVLFHAAAQIQKIFRGRQAREAVAKMKAKAKKGKKGKKGKK